MTLYKSYWEILYKSTNNKEYLMGFLRRIGLTLAGIALCIGAGCANYSTVESLPPESMAIVAHEYDEFIEEQQELQKERESQISAPDLERSAEVNNAESASEPGEIPRFPYFEELEARLQQINEETVSTWRNRDDVEISTIEEIMGELEPIITIIERKTGLDVQEYDADEITNSVWAGCRRYYQTLLVTEPYRFETLDLITMLEFIGRDLDTNLNSSDYEEDKSVRNRAESLARVFAAGVICEIMQDYHRDIGRELFEKILTPSNRLMEGRSGDMREYLNTNRYEMHNRVLLTTMIISQNPLDILGTWKRLTQMSGERFYREMDELARDAPGRYQSVKQVYNQLYGVFEPESLPQPTPLPEVLPATEPVLPIEGSPTVAIGQ